MSLPLRKEAVLAKPRSDVPVIEGVSWMASVVMWAVDHGARSQEDIKRLARRRLTELTDLEERIGQAIAELMYERLIGSVGQDYSRVYFRKRAA